MKISLGTLEKPGFLEFFQKSENFMQKKLKKGLTFSTVDYIIIKQVGDRPTEKIKKWNDVYYRMRYEMMKKYRPDKAEKFNDIQTDIFDFISE